MRKRVGAAEDSLARGHGFLRGIGEIDLTPQMLAKEQIDAAMAALVSQGQRVRAVMEGSTEGSRRLSGEISGMVVGLQFQDRAKQELEATADALRSAAAAVRQLAAHGTEPTGWREALVGGIRLASHRLAFGEAVGAVMAPAPVMTPAVVGGNRIELF